MICSTMASLKFVMSTSDQQGVGSKHAQLSYAHGKVRMWIFIPPPPVTLRFSQVTPTSLHTETEEPSA